MLKISIDKKLFEDILLKKTFFITKDTTKYWKKELLEPTIKNDRISYSIKQVKKLTLTNGLGEEKPSIVIECKKIDYDGKKDQFLFELGKIIEQKNTQIEDNYKDNLIEQLLKEKAQLEEHINRDHLTTVYNRRKMEFDLNLFVNQNNASLLNAVFIDVDKFKKINDDFGHDYGDKVLVYISNKLKEYAYILNGEVYRYAGEEFLILCFSTKDFLKETISRLKEDIKYQKIFHPREAISTTVSIGVSFFSTYKNKDIMLRKADEALLTAKNLGRDTIVYSE